MLPDGINGSNGHLVVVGAGGVNGGEDQEVAAVHALGSQLEGVSVARKGEGWYRGVLQLVSASLLANAEPDPLVLPDCHRLEFCKLTL